MATVAEDTPGFLGRWSRRKTDALEGRPLQEPAPVVQPTVVGLDKTLLAKAESEKTGLVPPATSDIDSAPPVEKVLSLDDVKLLTKDSDFKPFMAQNVGPSVRNAAMKKLFADPHFNIMDGLDIYIDDYSKSDPIPESMLRQMTSAKFLKLFEDEEKEVADQPEAAAPVGDNANNLTNQTVAQCGASADIATASSVPPENPSQPELLPDSGASPENHADIDLRLQPDHASPAPVAGRGT